jgi:hypothetical protein
VSINDTSLIHYTILNRPGRFDRIFEIRSPQTEKEVLEIILSKTNVIKANYCSDNPLFLKEIDMNNMADILKDCIKYKFTQAEIANAVLEQAFIDINIDMKATDTMSKNWLKTGIMDIIPFLKEAIKKHLKTKEAQENCNFNNKNPDDKLQGRAIALNPSPLFR